MRVSTKATGIKAPLLPLHVAISIITIVTEISLWLITVP